MTRRIPTRLWFRSPSWAPDGRWIAVATSDASGTPTPLYLVRPDGSAWRRVEPSTWWGSERIGDRSRLLPDGTRLVAAAGGGGIDVFDPGRHEATSVTDFGEYPLVSPRGTRIVFQQRAHRSFGFHSSALYVVSAAGGGMRRLTSD